MASIYDLYEFYLEARDLKDKAHVVTVDRVGVQSVFVGGKTEKKIVLKFVNRRKSMILNKTQAGAMEEVTGKDDYTKWAGAEIVLVAGRASNGKTTIVITTRENSGDVDLMYPKPDPTQAAVNIRPVNIPKEWIDASSDEAVAMAGEAWQVKKSVAKEMLDRAVKDEALSAFLPKDEFKEYVSCT